MSDTKMLQMVLDGQASLKRDIREGFQGVSKKIGDTETNLTKRLQFVVK